MTAAAPAAAEQLDIRQQVAALVADRHARHANDPDQALYSIGAAGRNLREFLARAALLRLQPFITDALTRCRAAGAVSALDPLEVHPGVKAFSPVLEGKKRIEALFLVIDGQRLCFTVQDNSDPEKGIKRTTLESGFWSRGTGGDLSDGERDWLASHGSVPEYHDSCGSVEIISIEGRMNANGMLGEEGFGNLMRQCELLRPLVAALDLPQLPTAEEMVRRFRETKNVDDLAQITELNRGAPLKDALAADGGWPGAACDEFVRLVHAEKLRLDVRKLSDRLVANHDTMVEHGYVWGRKRLCYGDLDRYTFAVPTGRPERIALVHENIDLFSAVRRFLVVADRAEDGTVTRVEIHPMRRHHEPRHPLQLWAQPELIGRLLADQLPEAPAMVDLKTGESRLDRDALELARYFEFIVLDDAGAADKLRGGKKLPMGYSDEADFDDGPDEDDVEAEEDEAPAP